MKAYDDNEVNADSQYKGKKLEVTGYINDIGKDILDRSFVILGNGDEYELIAVQCYVSKDILDDVAKLKKGDKVTIVGNCKGKSISVSMENCTIK